MRTVHRPGFCYVCDTLRGYGVTPGHDVASPRPLLLWAAVIFVAGFVIGSLIAPVFISLSLPYVYLARSTSSSMADHALSVVSGPVIEEGVVRTGPASRRTARSHPPEDPPPASAGALSSSLPVTLSPRQDPAAILDIIRAAAIEFGQDGDELVRVAFCESSYRPDAIGDGGLAVGLFQFHIWRWNLNAPKLGYHEDLRSDPVASSRVAAFAFSTGQRGAWTCAR